MLLHPLRISVEARPRQENFEKCNMTAGPSCDSLTQTKLQGARSHPMRNFTSPSHKSRVTVVTAATLQARLVSLLLEQRNRHARHRRHSRAQRRLRQRLKAARVRPRQLFARGMRRREFLWVHRAEAEINERNLVAGQRKN